jgi:hypothetical protein
VEKLLSTAQCIFTNAMLHPIYRIFISSTFLDLAPERKAVEQAVEDWNCAVARAGIVLTHSSTQEVN